MANYYRALPIRAQRDWSGLADLTTTRVTDNVQLRRPGIAINVYLCKCLMFTQLPSCSVLLCNDGNPSVFLFPSILARVPYDYRYFYCPSCDMNAGLTGRLLDPFSMT
jgi:hypothetical protein